MLRRSFLFGWIAACSLFLVGCGGPSGPSIQERIEKAKNIGAPDARAQELIGIAKEQAKDRDLAGAESTMKEALLACAEVEDPAARAGVYLQLALAQTDMGNRAEGRRAAKAALDAAEKIDDAYTRAKTLARVGRAQGAADDMDRAAQTLRAAKRMAGQLDSLSGILVLGTVAESYHHIQREDDADTLIEEAMGLVEEIQDPQDQCKAFTSLAARQHAMGREGSALKTFDSALEAAEKIADPYKHAYTLTDVAEELGKADLTTKAKQVLAAAKEVSQQIKAKDQQQQLEVRIAKLRDEL